MLSGGALRRSVLIVMPLQLARLQLLLAASWVFAIYQLDDGVFSLQTSCYFQPYFIANFSKPPTSPLA